MKKIPTHFAPKMVTANKALSWPKTVIGFRCIKTAYFCACATIFFESALFVQMLTASVFFVGLYFVSILNAAIETERVDLWLKSRFLPETRSRAEEIVKELARLLEPEIEKLKLSEANRALRVSNPLSFCETHDSTQFGKMVRIRCNGLELISASVNGSELVIETEWVGQGGNEKYSIWNYYDLKIKWGSVTLLRSRISGVLPFSSDINLMDVSLLNGVHVTDAHQLLSETYTWLKSRESTNALQKNHLEALLDSVVSLAR